MGSDPTGHFNPLKVVDGIFRDSSNARARNRSCSLTPTRTEVASYRNSQDRRYAAFNSSGRSGTLTAMLAITVPSER